jgi:hypothetical protein
MFKHAKGFRGNKPPALRRRGAGESYVDSKNSLESLISEHEAREHIEKNFPKVKIGRAIDLEREAAAKATQQKEKEIAAASEAGKAREEKRKEARKRARKRQREQFLRKHAQLLVEKEAEEARAIRKARAQTGVVTQKAGDSSTGV